MGSGLKDVKRVNDRDGEEYEGILMGCSHFCVWLDFSLSALAIDITMGRYMHPSPRHRWWPRSGIVPKLETAVIRGSLSRVKFQSAA